MSQVEILGVFVGKAELIDGGLSRAIDKQRIDKRIWLWPQGLGEDQLGDARYHGGQERALHHYPAEHYAFWRKRYPERNWGLSAFGENLSTLGLREEQVCIGDIFRWGDALIQVSQPRSPCYRLNPQGDQPHLALQAQDNGRCGWFYRVIKPGFVSSHEPLELVQRTFPSLSVARALSHFYHTPMERSGLQHLQQCPALSRQWRERVTQRLNTGLLEDWEERLQGLPLLGTQQDERRYA